MNQFQLISKLLENQLTKEIILGAFYKAYCTLISNHIRTSELHIQYYKITAALQSYILSQISKQKFPSIIPDETVAFKWLDEFGVLKSANLGDFIINSSIYGDKITNFEHHLYILDRIKKLQQKEGKFKNVIDIQRVQQKQQRDRKYLHIQQQKALIFQQQQTNYLKQNIFFSAYSNQCKINFLKQSFQAVIQLNNEKINHNDITFRNFLYSIKHKCWKVIDFDLSCNYQIFFLQNSEAKCFNYEKLNQSWTSFAKSSISQEQNYLNKNQQLSGIKSLTSIELDQLFKDYKGFYDKYYGKKDSLMYGLMILKLLFNNKYLQVNIKEKIQELVNFYQSQKFQNQQLNEKICENFEPKYFEIVKFILKNMMTRSCSQRKRLDQLQKDWNQIVERIQANKSVKCQNFYQDTKKNTSKWYFPQRISQQTQYPLQKANKTEYNNQVNLTDSSKFAQSPTLNCQKKKFSHKQKKELLSKYQIRLFPYNKQIQTK